MWITLRNVNGKRPAANLHDCPLAGAHPTVAYYTSSNVEDGGEPTRVKPPAQTLCVWRPTHSCNIPWGGAGGVGCLCVCVLPSYPLHRGN